MANRLRPREEEDPPGRRVETEAEVSNLIDMGVPVWRILEHEQPVEVLNYLVHNHHGQYLPYTDLYRLAAEPDAARDHELINIIVKTRRFNDTRRAEIIALLDFRLLTPAAKWNLDDWLPDDITLDEPGKRAFLAGVVARRAQRAARRAARREERRVNAVNAVFASMQGTRDVHADPCSICLAEGNGFETVCGHRYHYECLAEWLKQHSTCPLCRANLK